MFALHGSEKERKLALLMPLPCLPFLACNPIMLTRRQCDSNDACALCLESSSSSENEFWKALGCFRGPLAHLADVMLPGGLF